MSYRASSLNKIRRMPLLLEVLEDRSMPSVTGYQPDLSARSWMQNETLTLLQNLDDQAHYAGQWVVGVSAGHNVAQLSANAGVSGSTDTGIIANTYQWNFASDVSPEVIAGWLQAHQNTGQIDFYYPLLARQQHTRFTPNDPQFGNQWHLRNTGQGGGVAGIDANVTTPWDTVLGRNVQIAVVDTGVTIAHPDLQPNLWVNSAELPNGLDDDGNGLIDDFNGWDFNGNDNNPTPQTNDHGTSVAGVAAARGNNNLGVSGAAIEGQLIGIRLIEAATTDIQEANALSYQRNTTDIYSNSWGPADNLTTVAGPGPLTLAAMQDNYFNGRGGLGNTVVFANGNGGTGDNSNYDGYANSRFAIGVSAVGNNGVRASYSEPGANILVTAPSNGGTLGITTTSGTSTPGYTSSFGGTSSAAPLVSGVIALILEARPDLTARDVQHILVNSSTKVNPTDTGWSRNNGGTGFWINDKYGFGMVNADAAVNLARTWTKVRSQVSVTSGVINSGLTIPDNNATGITVTFNVTQDMTLEHVEFVVDITHTWRGDLRFVLTSPSGTQSLVERRGGDSNDNFVNWKFMTVRNWGESPVGQWRLQIADRAGADIGTLNNFQMNFFGQAPPIPPTATNDGYNVLEDNTLNVTVPGVLTNDLLASSAQLISGVSNGTLTFNTNGSFRYVPASNFFGTDSFVYQAVNEFGTSTATVTINVVSVNDAPVAANDGIFVVKPGTVFTLNAPGLLGNDTDVDHPLSSLTTNLLTSPFRGDVVLNPNGSFTYTPFLGSGPDSFSYNVSDGLTVSNTATVTLQLNTQPIAQDDSFFSPVDVNVSGNVLSNDVDFDLNPMNVELISTTANGALTLNPDGSFLYVPNPGYFGIDSFNYRARDQYYTPSDPNQVGNIATVTIRMNRLPVGQVDSYSTKRNTALEVFYPGVLGNDYDLDTPLFGDLVRGELITTTINGSLIFGTNGYFKYTPNDGYTGPDSFTYRVFDGMHYGNESTVSLNVQATPIAYPDSYVSFSPLLNVGPNAGLLANDFSPNINPLSARLITNPTGGSITLNPDGSFIYVALNGFAGVDQFTYVASDGIFDSDPATVSITVFNLNNAPHAVDDNYSTPASNILSVPAAGILSNDTDSDGDSLIATLVTGPRNGSLEINANGGFVYTPQLGFNGTDSFTYQASDGIALSNVATVTITVGTPPPPVLDPNRRIILGQESGGELKVLAGETGATLFTIQPYTSSFTGGIRVATGDINGDNIPDIITAPGVVPSTGTVRGVRVFNGANGTPFAGNLGTGLFPYGTTYRGGIQIAVGDINGDGINDIVTGADLATTSPQVRTLNGVNGSVIPGWRGGFSPYTGTAFGGVRVATGDVNGDGRTDIITAPGAGITTVKVYNPAASTLSLGLIRSFTAYSSAVSGGVFVAAGDLDGDGRAEVITGAASNASGHVRVFNGNTGTFLRGFSVAGTTSGPARVAVGDINGDGRLDLVVGIRVSNSASKARVYDALTLSEMFGGQSPFAYGNNYSAGLFVAAWGKTGLSVSPPL